MKALRRMIRDTLIGGILFLVPMVFLVVVVGKAFQIMKVAATPLANLISPQSLPGFAVVELLTTAILILSCFLVGMLARSPLAQKLSEKLDTILLQMIPGYAWVKGMTGDIRDEDAEEALKPVLVRFDDQFQLAFEVDRATDGLVAVYLPGAPYPRSGTGSDGTGDRIQAVDVGFKTVVRTCKNLGRDSMVMLPDSPGKRI